jgi:PAS domain S-box-containing protein
MTQKKPDPDEALSPTLSTGAGKSDSKEVSKEPDAAEEAPTQSVRRYEHLVHAAKAYIFTVIVKDGQPVCTIHYPGVLQVTGYAEEEYAAQPMLWINMICPEDRDVVRDQIARLLRGETPPPVKHRFVHKDGSIRWVRNTSVPVFDSAGELVAYDGMVVDISEAEFTEVKQEREIDDLTSALAMVKTLQNLLPICCSCKKIRDDKGYWQELESYMAGHYPAITFTHGLCEACAKKLYGWG